MKFDKSQLLIYAVTDRAWTGKMSLYEQTEAALKGGATMVQLREKGLRDDNVEEYLEEAKKMRALTEKYNVPLLIDDNIKLAKACGADGVHVGQNDMDAGLARQLLGPDKILGVTAKTVEQALKAQSQTVEETGESIKTVDETTLADVSRQLTLRLLSGDGESLDSVDTSSAEYQTQYQTVHDALAKNGSSYQVLATKVNNAVKLSIEKYISEYNKNHAKAKTLEDGTAIKKGRISVSSSKSFQRQYPVRC